MSTSSVRDADSTSTGHDLPSRVSKDPSKAASCGVPRDLRVMCQPDSGAGKARPPLGLQAALIRAGVDATDFPVPQPLAKVLSRLRLVRPFSSAERRQSRGRTIMCASWGYAWWSLPDVWTREIAPWCFDCWEPMFPLWDRTLRDLDPRDVFFSARDVIPHFTRSLPRARCHWLPEAIEPEWMDPSKPLDERSIGVLELGRRLESFHDAITPALQRSHVTHVYSTAGEQLFPGTEGVRTALADTRVLVCHPKSMTHAGGPRGAGSIETVTQRYFEAFASRALVVGHCPRELRDLFGFDPVISSGEPIESVIERIAEIARHPERFQAHADRCYERCLEVGTFDARASSMLEILSSSGSSGQLSNIASMA